MTNDAVYGDDGDLISLVKVSTPRVGRVPSGSSRGLCNDTVGLVREALHTSGLSAEAMTVATAMTAALQQATKAGLGMGICGFNLGLVPGWWGY